MSLSGFDVTAVLVVGCEYDLQVLKLQHYSLLDLKFGISDIRATLSHNRND